MSDSSPRRATERLDAALIADALAPLRARWAAHAALAPATPGALRGIEAKSRRLGVERSEMHRIAGENVAEAALLLATLRDAATNREQSNRSERRKGREVSRGAVFVLFGADRSAAIAAAAALKAAKAGRRVVAALCSTRQRPEDADAAALWDRLESIKGVERYRIPDAREAAHFRAGIETVGVVIEALGGAAIPARGPVAAGVDLVRRARSFGVPCLAVGSPIGLDTESGARRRGAPGADVTVALHRPLVAHAPAAARRLTGEVLVAPFGVPVAADSASA